MSHNRMSADDFDRLSEVEKEAIIRESDDVVFDITPHTVDFVKTLVADIESEKKRVVKATVTTPTINPDYEIYTLIIHK